MKHLRFLIAFYGGTLVALCQTAPTISLNHGYTQQTVATYSQTCPSNNGTPQPCTNITGDLKSTFLTPGNLISASGALYGITGSPVISYSEQQLYTVGPEGTVSVFGTFTPGNACSVALTTGNMTTSYLMPVGYYNLHVRSFYLIVMVQETAWQASGAGASLSCTNGLMVSAAGPKATYDTSAKTTVYLVKIGIPLSALP